MPYASVVVAGKKRGTVSDNRGIFEMNIPADTKALQVTCVGYAKKIVPVKRGMINMYAVYLEPAATELHELVVKNRKYSKRIILPLIFSIVSKTAPHSPTLGAILTILSTNTSV